MPYEVTPTQSQLEWQKMEYYMFVHFGPNTFTDVEWGDGKENPAVFNPTDLDCRQWAATAKAAGMSGIILTAKHHDGFCLWPSSQSSHTVRESLWKEGKGDVLRELSDACREYGIKFGIYVSPWDQNHPAYGTPEYNEVYAATLREVLTGYGDVFELWMDGANGEGPNGKAQVYDWELFHRVIRECQPGAVMFSDIGPDARWIGNERGYAGLTNWSRLDTRGFTPGKGAPSREILNSGSPHGEAWIPGEADVSIRPGWFWSASTDDKVKSVEELMDIYRGSVGRNANLLLNVPPDRTGRINPADSVRLMEFRRAREAAFGNDLALGASIEASSIYGRGFEGGNLSDGDYETYWIPAEESLSAEFVVTLPSPSRIDHIALQEYIPLGQRVKRFEVTYRESESSDWKPLAEGTTIGYKRILNFEPVTASRVKVYLNESLAVPVLSAISIYDSAEQ
jgi:alpha-L-fucosidase